MPQYTSTAGAALQPSACIDLMDDAARSLAHAQQLISCANTTPRPTSSGLQTKTPLCASPPNNPLVSPPGASDSPLGLSLLAGLATMSETKSVQKPWTKVSPRQSTSKRHSANADRFPHKCDGEYGTEGRIGIYNRQERAQLLRKFKEKRSRRCWGKIRYSVRKNIATKKIRINGRFAKKGELA